MANKKTSNASNASLESNQNTELEKKVDELLSLEEAPKKETKIPVSEDDGTSAPLLPSNELPDFDPEPELPPEPPVVPKADVPVQDVSGDTPLLPGESDAEEPITEEVPAPEPEQTPEPQKVKFYESLGPKPIAPEKFDDTLGLEDANTGKAVDEIVASEADELLDAKDHDYRFASTKSSLASPARPPKMPKKKRSKKWIFYLLFLVILLAAGAVAAFPDSRYLVLNQAGVRVASSVTVLDDTTGQPLKNAEFAIDGKSAKTDKSGAVQVDGVTLGKHELVIKKAAFAEVKRTVVLGWGSNPLGEIKMSPVGSQYKINVVDFLSKQPVKDVEASVADASAISNDKGEITITVPKDQSDTEKLEVSLSGEGLRTEKLEIQLGNTAPSIVDMVPSQKHVFISKRNGVLDVYKIDVDGKNEEKVLAGTGKEKPEAMALAVNPDKGMAALISTRDNTATSTLTLINVSTNETKTIAQSERLQMVGWIDTSLAYVKIIQGEAANSPNRHKLTVYNTGSGSERDLASANYFNDVMLVNKSIYYAPTGSVPGTAVGLFKTNAEGNDKKTVYDKEVWNIFRTSFSELSVSMGQEWYTVNLENDSIAKAAGAPAVAKSRFYATNQSGSDNLWVDERDGRSVLLDYKTSSKTDETVVTKAGIKNPVQWLNANTIVYRVSSNQETADYVLNINAGEPRKIKDVTDTGGVDRWYYY